MKQESKTSDEVLEDIIYYLTQADETWIAEIANRVCLDHYSWDYSSKTFIVTNTDDE